METSAQGQMEILRLLRGTPTGLTRDQLFDQSTVYDLSQAMSGDIRLLQQQMSIVRFGANVYCLTEFEEQARAFHMTDAERAEAVAEFDRKVKAKALAGQPKKVEQPEPEEEHEPELGEPEVDESADNWRITEAREKTVKDLVTLDQDVKVDTVVLPPLVAKEIEQPAKPLPPPGPSKAGRLYRNAITGKVALVVYTYGRLKGITIDQVASYLPDVKREDVARVMSQLSSDRGGRYPHYFDKENDTLRRVTLHFIWSNDFDYPFKDRLPNDVALMGRQTPSSSNSGETPYVYNPSKFEIKSKAAGGKEQGPELAAAVLTEDHPKVTAKEEPVQQQAEDPKPENSQPEEKLTNETGVNKIETRGKAFLAALYTNGELKIGFGAHNGFMITLNTDQTLQVAKLLRGL